METKKIERKNYGCPLTPGCVGHDGHPGKCSEKLTEEHKTPERFGKPAEESVHTSGIASETADRDRDTPRDKGRGHSR